MTEFKSRSKNLSRGFTIAALMFSTSALANQMPPYQNLMAAKQLVQSVSYRVQYIIGKCQGGQPDDGGWGGSGRPGGNGPRIPGIVHGERAFLEAEAVADEPVDFEADLEGEEDDVLENDHLANLALQVMGRELTELGQVVDQAAANYGTPAFWSYWQQACHKTQHLIVGNQGAKVAASLPLQGLVAPQEFDPNDVELHAVRQQLWCP